MKDTLLKPLLLLVTLVVSGQFGLSQANANQPAVEPQGSVSSGTVGPQDAALYSAAAREGEKYLNDSIPARWEYEPQNVMTTPSQDPWWNSFGDPTLTELIRRAVDNNYNVLVAQQRIESARQMWRQSKAAYWPTVGLNAGWTKSQQSGRIASSPTPSTRMDYFTLGLSMNWELDVFGRITAQAKAEKAQYQASIADYDATLVSLCSNVARAYFQLRMAQAEIKVAQANIATQDSLLKIANIRYECGLVAQVDVVQAQIVVAQTQSTLPPLNATVATSINEIAVLLGVYPDEVKELLTPRKLPEAPPLTVSCDPSQLLRRRPDIVGAERQIAYYAAMLGVAKKDFLPALELRATAATESHNLKNMFGSHSFSYSIMPTLTWTVFDGFARSAKVAAAKADLQAEIDTYNQSVITAVQEVNNAMVDYETVVQRLALERQLLKFSVRELELQVDRYTQGLTDYYNVAQALINVLQYQNNVTELQASELTGIVSIYTALGGGWD